MSCKIYKFEGSAFIKPSTIPAVYPELAEGHTSGLCPFFGFAYRMQFAPMQIPKYGNHK